jgi:hypothetical protein
MPQSCSAVTCPTRSLNRVASAAPTSATKTRELETLGELGLNDRLCLFMPPVSEMEVARRLTVSRAAARVLRHMGALRDEKKHRILALTSIGSDQCVVTAPRRHRVCLSSVCRRHAGPPPSRGSHPQVLSALGPAPRLGTDVSSRCGG